MRTLACGIGVVSLLLLGGRLLAQENRTAVAIVASSGHAFARGLLRELVEIDTTPARGCSQAAEAMAARLRSAGFADSDVQLLGPRPDRQNLVVRLRGRTRAKPILLIAHLDVVDAPREGWSAGLDPFRLTERDGFFYGRGVLDDKCQAAMLVANFIRLRAEGYVPDRDIVVALTADEEAGHADNALPQFARAVINCRVFPGDTVEFVRNTLVEVLADPGIKLTLMYAGQPSPVSPLLPEVMGSIEKLSHEMWPEIPVLPVMDPWASDSARLRRAGIPTFGVSGTFGELDLGNAHGTDERLSVAAFDQGVEFVYRLLKSLTGGDPVENR